ncbi:MAG: DUF2330 domain-containing protein [Actinomycetota bacterium]|nr:DUF2330 domain-containing protein [Actinomycetota bacterium]
MRTVKVLVLSVVITALAVGPVLACGGLIAPNGSVNLVRTTTLAAYVDDVEHYVTSFEFTGAGGGKFGSIVPLPDVPSDVDKAGRWTLQRLVEEVQPPVPLVENQSLNLRAAKSAEVLLEKRVSALDVTVLRGGGDEVGKWAKDNGFFLPPDAPEVLDFYAERSPIFMAVRFDLKRAQAKDLQSGDGIPVHLTIPTDRPWVPLRILALGREPEEIVEADVFLLNQTRPTLMPKLEAPGSSQGLVLERSEEASELMLTDLAGDRGMEWLPTQDMWLDYIRINLPAAQLDHDLALSVDGDAPSPVDAGFALAGATVPKEHVPVWAWVGAGLVGLVVLVVADRLVSSKR